MYDCPRLPLSPLGGWYLSAIIIIVFIITVTTYCQCVYLDTHLDVYSWGRNSNFTLGHGDDKERNTPEVVDAFTRILHVSIKEVSK